jgi:DNA-binding response OmpR family regulator
MAQRRGRFGRSNGSRAPVRPVAREPKAPRSDGIPTVLVIDDEEAIRDFLCSALEGEGYAVLAARDGLAALSLCERHAVDVILLDLMMPRLNGLGFLSRFKELYGLDGVAIYVMSAVRAAVEHAAPGDVAGAFVKPFDLDDLLDTIASDIASRHRNGHPKGGLNGPPPRAQTPPPAARQTLPAPARSVDTPH